MCAICALSIRSPGSAAINMCLVASGAADAYYHLGIHCWDMAGGTAVLTEAGGVIVDVSGEPPSRATRRPLHPESSVSSLDSRCKLGQELDGKVNFSRQGS